MDEIKFVIAIFMIIFGIMFVRGCRIGLGEHREFKKVNDGILSSIFDAPLKATAIDAFREDAYYPTRWGFDFGWWLYDTL